MIKISRMIGGAVLVAAIAVPLATANEASIPPVDRQAFVTCVALAPTDVAEAPQAERQVVR